MDPCGLVVSTLCFSVYIIEQCSLNTTTMVFPPDNLPNICPILQLPLAVRRD